MYRNSPGTGLAFAIMLTLLATSAAGSSLPTATAVRTLWSSVDAAWNARDAVRFSELFTEDSRFGFVGRGESLQGRAVIHRNFAERFPRFAPNLRHRTSITRISDIAAGVCAVDGTVNVLRVADDAKAEAIRTFSIFAVMLQTDKGWKIRELRVYQMPPERTPRTH